jgi:hypothetical protein
MVIHPIHPKLGAEIVINSEPLKEYDDDGEVCEDTKVVTKYVQVEDDAQFGVRYTIPRGLTGVAGVRGAVKIDGKIVVQQTIPSQQLDKCDATRRAHQTRGNTNGRNYTRKFRFAQLNIGQS